jgi:hypothetical protein
MINQELDLAADFPASCYEEWRMAVEAELKGALFEKKLLGHTFECIDIQPLYTAEHWRSSGDPSGFPRLRAVDAGEPGAG